MKRLILLCLALAITGCAPIISHEMHDRADPTIDMARLFSNPDDYQGKTVILGGIIASSRNTIEGAYIEVLQKPLNYRDIPEDTDASYGRFLVVHDGYLDTAVYAPERYIAVAGVVIGRRTGMLGEMQYQYPLIRSLELHIVDVSSKYPHIFFSIDIYKSF